MGLWLVCVSPWNAQLHKACSSVLVGLSRTSCHCVCYVYGRHAEGHAHCNAGGCSDHSVCALCALSSPLGFKGSGVTAKKKGCVSALLSVFSGTTWPWATSLVSTWQVPADASSYCVQYWQLSGDYATRQCFCCRMTLHAPDQHQRQQQQQRTWLLEL